jgi:pimeloyl-ACP methyl ester carboxylesterase
MPSLRLRGTDLHYLDQGTGFPVVFGPSYLWDAGMWAPQVERLAERYRCIVPDLWGHGESGSIPEIPYPFATLAEDMTAFVAALGLESFALVGLSVGGMWAARLALAMPERVGALVLMDTFVGAEPAATQTRYFAMLDAIERAGAFLAPLVEQVVPLFFAPATLARNDGLVDDFRRSLLGMDKHRLPSVVALGRTIFSRDSILERLGEVRCPTLIAVGRHDRPRPVAEAVTMAERIPGARLEIIEDSGHVSNLEQPAAVLALLEGFLAETTPGRARG